MKRICVIFILLILCANAEGQTTSVLYNFDSGLDGFAAFGSGGAAVTTSLAAQARSGDAAMAFSHNQSAASFGGVFDTSISPSDWSGFEKLQYWVKTDSATNNQVIVEIKESSGEVWKQRIRTPVSPTYQKVELDLADYVDSGFDVSAGGANYALELTNIVQVNFVFFPSNPVAPANVSYFVDDVELVDIPASELAIEPASFNFGTLSPAPGAFRFNSASFTCTYATAQSAWHVAVFTTNVPHQPALVSSSSDTILLKYHTPNFGGGTASPYAAPDPNDIGNWTNFYSFVFDPHAEGSDGFRTQLANSEDFSNEGSIPFSFAIDAGGAVKTQYTGTVFIEFVVD